MRGDIIMNLCIMEVQSVTYAQKAKIYLKEKGYKCEVIRNTDSCGYSIRVNADCNVVKKILDEKKIVYKEKDTSSW